LEHDLHTIATAVVIVVALLQVLAVVTAGIVRVKCNYLLTGYECCGRFVPGREWTAIPCSSKILMSILLVFSFLMQAGVLMFAYLAIVGQKNDFATIIQAILYEIMALVACITGIHVLLFS